MAAITMTSSLQEIIVELGITEENLDYWSNYQIKGLGKFYTDFEAPGDDHLHIPAAFEPSAELHV